MAWPCLKPSSVLRYPNTSRDLRPNSTESTQKKRSVGIDQSPIGRLRKISEDLGLLVLFNTLVILHTSSRSHLKRIYKISKAIC